MPDLSSVTSEGSRGSFADSLSFHIRRTNLEGLCAIGFKYEYRSFFKSFDTSCISSDSSPFELLSTQATGRSMSAIPLTFVNYSLFKPGCKVCQFKHVYRDYVVPLDVLNTNRIQIGSFLIVKSHINHFLIDLGIITTIWSTDEYLDHKRRIGRSLDEEENYLGLALRTATMNERAKLPLKCANEIPTLQVARQIVQELGLLMDVYVAEFQFDGRILYLYYTATSRVDYRELVRQMAEACNNVRVKMKKTNLCRKFVARRYASVALETGQLPSSEGEA